MTPPLSGSVQVPGDKSISHRALILAALAVGRSRIEGLNEGSDVGATIAALRAMGARIERDGGAWHVNGVGVGGLLQPEAPLDMGNSATAARLLMGLVASHRIRAEFTGDASLSRRPMDRVAAPLRRIGARISRDFLPLIVEGLAPAIPTRHRLEIPSAQVKSALLLAGLNTPGLSEVIETRPTRDHTELLLKSFGADIDLDGTRATLCGEPDLRPQIVRIPGDFSSASFLIVAALIVPGSQIRLERVGMNPSRTGLWRVLTDMGARIDFENVGRMGHEVVADLVIRHSGLRGVDVPPGIVPDLIDEYPILFIAAAFAQGTTRARGVAELRLKESDRIAAMAAGLGAIGVGVEESEDGLVVHGSGGGALPGGATIDPSDDHRVAMAFAVAGLHCVEPIGVAAMDCADTSFPGFAAALAALGAPARP